VPDWACLTAETPSAWQTFANLLDPQPNPFLGDPVGWVRERLGEFMWSKQRQVAESVRDNRYTAVPSAHDTGKSFTASRLASWWLDVHPPGEAFVVTIAPTTAQVEAIPRREIGKAHRKGDLPGLTLDAKWYIGQWFLVVDWSLEGQRLLIKLTPLLNGIDPVTVELDAKSLKKRKEFFPLLHRLSELTRASLTPGQLSVMTDLVEVFRARGRNEISIAEADSRAAAIRAGAA
jgi:hypothetical protein